jgi:hypothetical protein
MGLSKFRDTLAMTILLWAVISAMDTVAVKFLLLAAAAARSHISPFENPL